MTTRFGHQLRPTESRLGSRQTTGDGPALRRLELATFPMTRRTPSQYSIAKWQLTIITFITMLLARHTHSLGRQSGSSVLADIPARRTSLDSLLIVPMTLLTQST